MNNFLNGRTARTGIAVRQEFVCANLKSNGQINEN